MTSRQRLLTLLAGKVPDCVPVMPDISNMVPARLTGKPFWQLYLYNDPPLFEAYISAAKHFNLDSLMDGYFGLAYPWDKTMEELGWERFIVFRSPERIITQWSRVEKGERVWSPCVDVYYVADPPTGWVPVEKLGLPRVPKKPEPIEGVKPVDRGPEGLKRVKKLMGEQGLVGTFVTGSCALGNPDAIYNYYDHPELHEQWARERIEDGERRFDYIKSLEVKPDFICVGGSGTLVFQTVKIFRRLALPAVKRVIDLATEAGLPAQIHSCGPEKELVKIMAEETNLTIIDPLEQPPMGDCDLAELKRLYGDKIMLKGNLHTTRTMLHGTVEDVVRESKRAIDAAAEGGGFVLSTGDQCGRDTPDENIRAIIETARTYGRY